MLAKIIIAGSVFLCSAGNTFAAANLNLATSFTPAETGRVHMDTGGTWDGSNDAAGDTFSFTIDNAGPDPAFDIRDITVDIPSGFILGQVSVPVTRSSSCSNLRNITANQTGLNKITIAIPADTDIAANCSYQFDLVLTTNTTVVANPAYLVTFNSSYNEINNNNGSQQLFSASESIAVNAGGLSLTKTTTESNPLNNTVVTFDIVIANTGTGGLFDVRLSDLLGTGLTNLNIIAPATPTGSFIPLTDDYQFNYIPGGTTVNVTVEATTEFNPVPAVCPTLTNTASVIDRTAIIVPASIATIPFDLGALSINHLNRSRCVLCGTGTVTLRLRNTSAIDINNLVISEDLLSSELRILNGTSTFGGSSVANPSRTGSVYTWSLAAVTVPAGGVRDLVFDVAYDTTLGINEDLAGNNTNIQASVDYALSCGTTQPAVTDLHSLVLDQPLPQVTKQGRNVDAGQGSGTYTNTVYGHRDDDVIWRVRIQNTGPVDLEDVLLNDAITGNFDINYVCPTEAAANSVATGGSTADCTSAGGGVKDAVNNFLMNNPFGAAGSSDVVANTFEDIFYVGKILTSCRVDSNEVNIEWGCDVDTPPSGAGGIDSASSIILAGSTVDNATASLSTLGNGALSNNSITQTIRGIDGGPEVGSRGIVTIRVVNDTGGTIRDVVIDDILPPEYVVDTTAPITYTFNPAYGNLYGGAADEVTHNIDLTPANLLNNTNFRFTVTSNGDTGDNPIDVDLFRHGDEFIITYEIVLIAPSHFDLVADLDIAPEVLPGTDPGNSFTINNDLTFTYDDTCTFTPGQKFTQNRGFNVFVEDLDVAISDALFILTNDPGTPLDLNVLLTNNGGHVADNYTAYITLGQAMTAQLPLPAGCSASTNLPPHPHWNQPAPIPGTAAVFACYVGAIAPGSGNTETITISVIKAASSAVDDDLTFRADVVGEVTLFNGDALTLPAPASIAETTPNQQLANNYSLDAVRSRVLGFNLSKSAWYCSENGVSEPSPTVPRPTPANLNSQIGEDCNYFIESGGWFGFLTPGFTLIAVEDILVTDDLPDGQGFIPFSGSDPFNFTSTSKIALEGIYGGAGTTSLDETDISWNFNATGSGIVVKDEFFRVDFKTRLLNDRVDLAYPVTALDTPNLHGNTSTNIARTSFNAIFNSVSGDVTINVDDGAGIPGYPVPDVRTVDITEVEPNLIVTKQVCNESLSMTGVGTSCTPFADAITNGDTNDSYVYRIMLTNEASASGETRAPAFNVVSTDTLDAFDQMKIKDFATDVLDNDGDGAIDETDEGTISDNIVNNGIPAVITFSDSHSAPLLKVNPGDSVTFYYRVDPDDSIAPLQTLVNTVSMSYDSLEGAFGNQNPPQLSNTDTPGAGRARIYTSISETASVRMLPILTQPKTIIALSNTAPGGLPQPVVVGEEIQYELITSLPFAKLTEFVIRDELPDGITCTEAPSINLEAAPYSAAGFDPGTTISGPVVPSCTATEVVWNFGDQELKNVVPGRFDFPVAFIARVENTVDTDEGDVIRNGGGLLPLGTNVTASYKNENDTLVTEHFDSVDVVVSEPLIKLTKSFAVDNSDAADVLTVTVIATNTGTAAAYNLRVLDDLVGSKLTYEPLSIGGTDPPDSVDLSVPNRPIFSWTPRPSPVDPATSDYVIIPGAVKTFTFKVSVDTTAQPHEILDNTIQAQWNSLPSKNTALINSGAGPIGDDGTTLGLRNGDVLTPGIADPNNYEAIASDSTEVLPLTINKTDLDLTVVPTIGAHKNFQIEIRMPEGTTNNLVVEDNLAASAISYMLSHNASYDVTYEFQDISTINTKVPGEAAFNAFPAVDASATLVWDIGTVVTNTEDDTAGNAINPIIRINYFARVNNDTDTDDGDSLQNSAIIKYSNGEDATTEESLPSTTPVEAVVESSLALSKTVINRTSGAGPTADGDVLEFTLTADNTSGNSTAFDVNIVDTLPPELLLDITFTPVISGITPTGIFKDTPAGSPAGPLIWGRDNADNSLDIPAGQILVLTYRAMVQAATPNAVITNSALVDWTSLNDDDVSSGFERTGAGCPTITAPNDYCAGPVVAAVSTGAPTGLLKANPAVLNVSIGEEFTYRITVPAQATALHDVLILDDLRALATGADLIFVDVAKGPTTGGIWTPTNIGTPDNLIIADDPSGSGIDIPANTQVEIDITVRVRDTATNVIDLEFTNTATYEFNLIDNNEATRSPGSGDTTPKMWVVEPKLTVEKRGPSLPATVQFGVPIPYTLVVENTGTGPAFDTTVVDKLPDVADNAPVIGGTCDATPQIIFVRITNLAEDTVLRTLTFGTDFTVAYTASPTCELVVTALTNEARIDSGEKLLISYETFLDAGSQSAAQLTNIAGATQWFSLDTAGAGATDDIREYVRVLTDGTPGDDTDHEDAFTVVAEAPAVDVKKTVFNVSSNTNPGSDATPGDTLRYTIVVANTGVVDATGVTITDAVPANASYVANSTTLNTAAVADPSAGVSPLIAGIDISSNDLTPPLPAAGNGTITVGQAATVTFEVLLDAVITSGTLIENQALVISPATGIVPSDDPNVNGDDDPLIPGDEEPTQTLITSAPAFVVQKTSQDITGDPAVLEAGDTLRYTITVKNTGQESAVNTLLSDQVPANTAYVENTTTLNAAPVADPSKGVSAVESGLLINAPENTTAGVMRADTNPAADNVATITFDVVISPTVVDGAIISNQGFVSGDGEGSGIFPQLPSDDPGTPIPDDPTLDVVGNVPVVDVLKTVAILIDNGSVGIVEPGDTLRYTITTTNIGAISATNVVLSDDLALPVAGQLTYVAGSGRLDGLPADVSFAGSLLTATIGDLPPANSALVTFDVVVNAGIAAGTIISNQGFVSSNEVPVEPSDADGIDANGDQPTDIVVGNVQLLAITKQVLVVGGGVALAGGELEYVVRVTNIGSIAASSVVITDFLVPLVAGEMSYVVGSGLLNGLPAGVDFNSPVVSADYAATYGDLPPAGVAELRFRVLLDSALDIGHAVSNTGTVRWDGPASPLSSIVSIDIGGTPGSANLNGQVWHDTNYDDLLSSGEVLLQDWSVRLYRNNVLLADAPTDVNGVFQFSGLAPSLPADLYELRYVSPGATASSATLGQASSLFTDGPQRITNIDAASGSSLQNLNLPRQPNGVVYDAVLRLPVAGAQLRMINQSRSNQLVPADCFEDPNHQNQITAADGYYKFDLKFNDATRCAEGDEYEIQIQPPTNGFVGTSSTIITPLVSVTGAAQDVPNCPGTTADKIPATGLQCENSVSAVQPVPSLVPGAAGTEYYLKFLFDDVPSTDQIFNNHIPVDPKLEAAVAISKVASMVNVTRSQLVPYTITINNTLPVPLQDLNVIDNFPPGFKYVAGSSRIDGIEVEPQTTTRQLTWGNLDIDVGGTRVIKLLLVVGSGVGEGEYVNTAQVINSDTNEPFSGVASATVRVIPDPTFDCTDIIGKVFDDKNSNAYQDQGETGLAGVEVATARGLRVTTDTHGRFHITCAIVPGEVRGSNFIMKLDDRTLPSGYRVTTENPRVQRATRGKMLKFNFGASIHRVVRLDLADGVFEKGSSELRPQWQTRIEMLIIELQKDASILRLSYLGENETEAEVDNRLDAIEELISDRWQELDCCYKLTIETEVFWRKGKPSERKVFE